MASNNSNNVKSHTLPRKRKEDILSPLPFRSANPFKLHEVTTNAHLDYAGLDESLLAFPRGGGLLEPVGRVRTMKEYDQQIADLKKENFNLKLRIYFLEEQMQQKFSINNEDVHKLNIELKVELESLKKELLDKQELILKASAAMESLEIHQSSELQKLNTIIAKERKQHLDEIEKLNKELEATKKNLAENNTLGRKQSLDIYRQAFPGLDIEASVNSISESSKTEDFEEFKNVIDNKKEKIAELENLLKTSQEEIDYLKKDSIKRTKTIQGLLALAQNKTVEVGNLQQQLELKEIELQNIKEELNSNFKNDPFSKVHSRSNNENFSSLPSNVNLIELSDIQDKSNKNGVSNMTDEKMLETIAFEKNLLPQLDFAESISQDKINNIVKEIAEHSEVHRLKFKLSATEATVRMLAIKIRHFRHILVDAGLSTLITKCNGSDTNLFCKPASFKLKSKVAYNHQSYSLPTLIAFKESSNVPSQVNSAGDASFVSLKDVPNCSKSAPASPMKSFTGTCSYFLSDAAENWSYSSKSDEKYLLLEKDYEALKEESEIVLKELSSLKERENNLSLEKDALSDKYQKAINDIEELNKLLETKNDTYKFHHSAATDLQSENSKLKADIKNMEIKFKLLEDECALLKDKEMFANNELENIQASYKTATQKILELENEASSLRRRFRDSAILNADLSMKELVQNQQQEIICLRRFLTESQNACYLLKTRLEELAEFLESLLLFDENGILDLSHLTPQKIVSIQQHLALSRDLSVNLSQSMMALGELSILPASSMLNISEPANEKFDLDEYSSASDFLQDKSDIYKSKVSDTNYPINNHEISNSKKGEPVDISFNRVNFYENSKISSSRMDEPSNMTMNSTSDNFLLLLKPQENISRYMNDELPTFSLTFTPSNSMLAGEIKSKKLLDNELSNSVPCNIKEVECSPSESDSWSEPDRNVSLQRIGLDEHIRSPKSKLYLSPRFLARSGLPLHSDTDASSEMSKLSNMKRLGRGHQSHSSVRHLRFEDREVRRLQSRLHAVEEMNESLKSELKIYRSVHSIASSHTNSDDNEFCTKKDAINMANDGSLVTDMVKPLQEIASLRVRLEESIQAYEWLREEFEKRLGASTAFKYDWKKETSSLDFVSFQETLATNASNLTRDDVIHLQMMLRKKEDYVSEITEANERLRQTIDSVSNLLSEREALIKEQTEAIENYEKTITEITEKNISLEESLKKAALAVKFHEKNVLVLTEDISVLENTIKDLNSDRENIILQLRTADNSLQDETAKSGCLQKQLVSYESRLSESDKNLQETNNKLQETEMEKNTIINSYQKLHLELEEVKKILFETSEKHKAEIIHLEAILNEAQLQIKERYKAAETLEKEVSQLKKDMSYQAQIVSSKDKIEQDLQNRTKYVLAQLEDKEKELAVVTKINSELSEKLSLLQESKSYLPVDKDLNAVDPQVNVSVQELLKEIRNLRLQLERSIQTNNALRTRLGYLEQDNHRSNSKSSNKFTDNGNDNGSHELGVYQRQKSKSSDYLSDGTFDELNKSVSTANKLELDMSKFEPDRPTSSDGPADSNSVYSSPDLGIESDRSQLSSLDFKCGANGQLDKLNGWPWPVASLPVLWNLSPSDSLQQERLNQTFSGVPTLTVCSENKCETPKSVNCTPKIVALKEDHDNLKLEVTDAIKVIKRMKSRIVGMSQATSKEVQLQGIELFKHDCYDLYKRLKKSLHLISLFGTCNCLNENVNEQLQKENYHLSNELILLQKKLAIMQKEFEKTLEELKGANKFKNGMEKAVAKQLKKTHRVLKEARGNLEEQYKAGSGNSNQKDRKESKVTVMGIASTGNVNPKI